MGRAEKYRDVELLTHDGKIINIRLFFPDTPPWYVEFFRKGGEWKVYEGEDLFECLTSMRRELEKEGVKLLCNVSRRDVFSSLKSRQEHGGTQAYELVPGCRAEPGQKLIDLFDYVPPALVSTVDDQVEYFHQWLSSVKKKDASC